MKSGKILDRTTKNFADKIWRIEVVDCMFAVRRKGMEAGSSLKKGWKKVEVLSSWEGKRSAPDFEKKIWWFEEKAATFATRFKRSEVLEKDAKMEGGQIGRKRCTVWK